MAKKSFPSDKQDQYMIRFPEGMREELKLSAANMGRSMNAEIVQRLKTSFEEEGRDYYKVSLPEETRNALSIDALVHNVDFEERASQVLQAAYDKSSEYTFSLLKVDELAREGAYLEAELTRLTETQNSDFLMYYSKVVQLSHFVNSVVAAGKSIPAEILDEAKSLQQLAATEIDTIHSRVERIEHARKMDERFDQKYRELEKEITDSEVGEAKDN
ncbi:UNVERIFIED_ORG: plasmid stability protein [Rhizobium nepotum]|nr:plasmid stability protein [Rhizobium nepotum]